MVKDLYLLAVALFPVVLGSMYVYETISSHVYAAIFMAMLTIISLIVASLVFVISITKRKAINT